MNLFKKIYKNEIQIKPISLLSLIFLSLFYLLISGLISFVGFIFMDSIILWYGNEVLTILAFVFILIISNIIPTLMIAHMCKSNNIKAQTPFNQNISLKTYFHIVLLILGYVFIRIAILDNILINFEGPISEELLTSIEDIELNFVSIFLAIISALYITLFHASIFEELLFRGIFLNGLLKKYKPLKAIIYSSLVFGILHLNIPQSVNTTFTGMIFGTIYYYTKSIKICIFAHFINNFFAFLIPFSANSIFSKSILIIIGANLIFKSISHIKSLKVNEISLENDFSEN